MKPQKIKNYPIQAKQSKTKPKIQNYLKMCAKAEKEGKVVVSISLSPEQAKWVRNKRNTSAFFQRLIQEEMNKEVKTSAQNSEVQLMKKFSDMMAKYDFYALPKLEEMRTYKANITSFKKEDPAPEHYIFRIIMYEGEDGTLRYTPEQKQLLNKARKIPLERRVELLWQAVQDALKRTEIREGLPRIQFVAQELVDFSKHYFALDRAKVEKTTITALAEKAGIPFQQFYTKELPKIKKILDWNGVDVGI